jgi:Glutamine synthetase
MTLCEYIWIDAFGKLRSKTKVLNRLNDVIINDLPEWNFDGSSTGQAEGCKSDVILKPAAFFFDPFRKQSQNYLIMCDTYLPNGMPHSTNRRVACKLFESQTTKLEPLFGIEQEYILYDAKTRLPYNWEDCDLPSIKFQKQGPFYCGSGGDLVFGRHIVEEHLECCLYANINICGINAEVTPSQWEFQIGTNGPTSIGDHLWVARYILNRLTEKYGCYAEYHPKPMLTWNGSGCHTNFSTNKMRETTNKCKGIDEIIIACEKLSHKHNEHLLVYGNIDQNKLRLTGKYETSSFTKFTYGISDRGASIRIPLNVANDEKGYLEDRRPASNMDPYEVVSALLETVCIN